LYIVYIYHKTFPFYVNTFKNFKKCEKIFSYVTDTKKMTFCENFR
jgi:hypothetical protein